MNPESARISLFATHELLPKKRKTFQLPSGGLNIERKDAQWSDVKLFLEFQRRSNTIRRPFRTSAEPTCVGD